MNSERRNLLEIWLNCKIYLYISFHLYLFYTSYYYKFTNYKLLQIYNIFCVEFQF